MQIQANKKPASVRRRVFIINYFLKLYTTSCNRNNNDNDNNYCIVHGDVIDYPVQHVFEMMNKYTAFQLSKELVP